MHTLFRVAGFYALEEVAGVLIKDHPLVYFYLLPYFLLMSYVIINFFSAIVVYYLYELSHEEIKTGLRQEQVAVEAAAHLTAEHYDTLMAGITRLRAEIRSLKA